MMYDATEIKYATLSLAAHDIMESFTTAYLARGNNINVKRGANFRPNIMHVI